MKCFQPVCSLASIYFRFCVLLFVATICPWFLGACLQTDDGPVHTLSSEEMGLVFETRERCLEAFAAVSTQVGHHKSIDTSMSGCDISPSNNGAVHVFTIVYHHDSLSYRDYDGSYSIPDGRIVLYDETYRRNIKYYGRNQYHYDTMEECLDKAMEDTIKFARSEDDSGWCLLMSGCEEYEDTEVGLVFYGKKVRSIKDCTTPRRCIFCT